VSSEILLGALLVLALLLVAYLAAGRSRKPALDPRIETAVASLPQLQQELGGLKSAVDRLPSGDTLAAIQARLNSLEAVVSERLPSTLPNDLQEIDRAIQSIKGEYEPGKRIDEIHESMRRVMTVLAGARDRGQAGEFLLAETLKQLPPTMLDRDYRIRGKPVEFALVLPGEKRLPIDSKWAAADLIQEWEKTTDADLRGAVADEIEKAVLEKAAEVSKYIGPPLTTDIAVAAVPDAAYQACRKAQIVAYRDYNVLVVPYSMVAPFVLAFFNLQLKYGRTIELANLEEQLKMIEMEANSIEGDLEGKVKQAGTRANNAYESITLSIAKIRAAIEYLRTAPKETPASGQPHPQEQVTEEPGSN
jgi:DNA anti-recombination protein RmuC